MKELKLFYYINGLKQVKSCNCTMKELKHK